MTTTRPKFTKALLVRLSAVGLFICLGTFAVMHSLKGTADPENPSPESELTSSSETPEPEPGIPENKSDVTTASFSETVTTTGAAKPPPFQRPGGPPAAPGGTSTSSGIGSNMGGAFARGDGQKPMTGGQDKRTPSFSSPTGSTSSKSGSGSSQALLPPIRQPGSTRSGAPPTRPGAATGALIPPLVNNRSGKNDSTQPAAPPLNRASQPGASPASMANQDNSKSGNSAFPPLRPNQLTDRNDGPAPNATTDPSFSADSETGSASTSNGLPESATGGTPRSSSTGVAASFASRSGANNGFQAAPPARPSSVSLGNNPGRGRLQEPGTGNGTPNGFSPATDSQNNRPGTAAPTRTLPGAALATPPGTRPDASTTTTGGSTGGSSLSGVPLQSATGADSTRSAPGTSLTAAPINRRESLAGTAGTAASPTPGDTRFEGVQIPALAVQKIAPREVQVNREAVFELIVKNTGRSAAENVQVHDFVPDGARMLEAVPAPSSNSGGRISWDLGTLNPGQQISIKMKLLPERPGNLGSVAHVTFGAQASAQTVCTQPELAIRHEAPASVLIGQNVLLNIFIENKGNGAAENVVLQEDVPEGLEFPGGQRELEYPIGTLQPGETRNVQLRLRAAQVGQVRNVLVAHGAGQLQANDVVNLHIVAPKLNLQADGPNRKFLNRSAKHTFSIANQGTAPATNMQLVARLPRGLKFAAANNQGQYDQASHAVVWRLAKLDPQKKGSVELTTIPVATGNHQIQVQANADLNQQQQTTQTLVVQQLSELFFDIDDSADAIEVGTETTFRVRVINQGQIPATNVQVQVEFPAAIRPTAVEGAPRHQIRGQAVVLEPIPSMAPGQELSFVIRANASAAGDHHTVVSVRSDGRETAVSKEESTHVYADR